MAASARDLKGYDHQFVEPPPDALFCLICLCVARDPQQLICCGKVLCKGCLEEHKKHSRTYPHCRKHILSFPDKRSERDILSLEILCDNSSNGCEWVGELCSLDEHLASCGLTLLPCPNECHSRSKVVQLLRRDLMKHMKEECPRRQYECPHCQEAGEYQEMTAEHLDKCPMIEVLCQNHGCKTSMARYSLSMHRQECLFEMVPCKYTTIGCKDEVLRKDLREHEGDSQHHLQLAIDTIHQQQTRNTEQENILARLQSREMPMKYRFTNYDYHKTADVPIYSPPFYTSPGRYKMCIRVVVNGYKDGKGTHVSVYAYLMKGENDDHLPWPFTGTVTVKLLNQLEDENHCSRNIKFPPNNKDNQRVVNEEISSIGYGKTCYISHSKLGYDTAKNCQYLKDDCLYFKISVDAKSSSKPWLV